MSNNMENIIDNIRVLDLANGTGVLCGKYLADMGAEVIKIEPEAGDVTRRIAPFYKDEQGVENSLYHAFFNAGKKSVVVDINTDDGRKIFKGLVKTADVVIETAAPGTMEKLGLSYEDLNSINPQLVYCSITPFGQTGPWAKWKASSDTIIYAASGGMYELGEADKPPIQMGFNFLASGTCIYALTGIMAALYARKQTGLGDRIDVSIFDVAAAWRGSELGFQQQAPDYKVSMRKGSQGIMVPANFYKCKDGYAFMMASGRWPDVIQWMKEVGMDIKGKDDPKYLPDQGFNKYLWDEIGEINDLVNELAGHFTVKEFTEEGQKRKLPIGGAQTTKSILENPQYIGRNYFKKIVTPNFGEVLYPGRAFGFTAGQMITRGPAPSLGANTEEILGSINEKIKARVSAAAKKRRPLEGITVLDLGWVVAGPHGGRLLRELGATVIRIETSTRLDPMRIDARRFGVTEKGALQEGGWCFQDNNRNKLDFCLNMKAPEGRKIFEDLVKKADVVSCNFAPRGFNNMKLDFESLSRIKKDIIVLNASGLGNDGPWSTYMTFAPVLSCLTGVTSVIGYEGMGPYGYPGPLCDYTGGVAMAAAITSALYFRENTGKGQFIDLAQSETVLQDLGPMLLDQQLNGRTPLVPGNHHYLHQQVPHNCYECKTDNTWAVMAVAEDAEWQALVKEFGKDYPELADSRFEKFGGRLANEKEIDAVMARIFKTYEAKDIAVKLQKIGVSAAKVHSTWDTLYDNPQAKTTGYFRKIEFPKSSLEPDYLFVTGPIINIKSNEYEEYKPGPACGQDNEYILKNILGYDDEYIAKAAEEKTFI